MTAMTWLTVAVFAAVHLLIVTERVHSSAVPAHSLSPRRSAARRPCCCSGRRAPSTRPCDRGEVVTGVTTAIAGLYVWLRYFALA
ncbi:hypothetical protein [Streptomyces phaeochromogenes]